jgi:hypothetical protein
MVPQDQLNVPLTVRLPTPFSVPLVMVRSVALVVPLKYTVPPEMVRLLRVDESTVLVTLSVPLAITSVPEQFMLYTSLVTLLYVTVAPAGITTLSPEAGRRFRSQFKGVCQEPFPSAQVIVAALAAPVQQNIITTKTRNAGIKEY